MKPLLNRSVTLLELLIAISIISLLVIGIANIDIFSNYHVKSSNRRVKLQNEVSYVLEHMAKEIARAIGNEKINGANNVVDIDTTGNDDKIRIKIYIDGDPNGQREEIPNPTASQDHWIAYRFNDSGAEAYQFLYCSLCKNKGCNNNNCNVNWDTISAIKVISGFGPLKPGGNTLTDNYVDITLTACWDPDGTPFACGTQDNPAITMQNRIYMPSVSLN